MCSNKLENTVELLRVTLKLIIQKHHTRELKMLLTCKSGVIFLRILEEQRWKHEGRSMKNYRLYAYHCLSFSAPRDTLYDQPITALKKTVVITVHCGPNLKTSKVLLFSALKWRNYFYGTTGKNGKQKCKSMIKWLQNGILSSTESSYLWVSVKHSVRVRAGARDELNFPSHFFPLVAITCEF